MSGDLWVFAYGSLMWRPGFAHADGVPARLSGYSRAFCIYSVHYRGTPERPGLVLGLARGGVCHGMAFRVRDGDADAVRRYLREREMIYGVYREARVPVDLDGPGGGCVDAIAYVAEPGHPSFAGDLGLRRQAAVIRGAKGRAGTNLDYLANTVAHLRTLNIRQAGLERLLDVASGRRLDAEAETTARPSALALCRAWSRRPSGPDAVHRGQARAFSFRMNLRR